MEESQQKLYDRRLARLLGDLRPLLTDAQQHALMATIGDRRPAQIGVDTKSHVAFVRFSMAGERYEFNKEGSRITAGHT